MTPEQRLIYDIQMALVTYTREGLEQRKELGIDLQVAMKEIGQQVGAAVVKAIFSDGPFAINNPDFEFGVAKTFVGTLAQAMKEVSEKRG